MVPESSATPKQYVALALRRVPHIFLDIYIYIDIFVQQKISILMHGTRALLWDSNNKAENVGNLYSDN